MRRRACAAPRAILAAALLLALVPPPASAQVVVDRPPRKGAVPRSAEDSAKARRDSLKNQPLVRWEPADSVGLALMQRTGYQLVRYQSDGMRFGARDRTIVLTGGKAGRAAVQREPTLLVADTIAYTDTASTVAARGDSIVMRDPTRGEDVIATNGFMTYDMNTKEGKASNVTTAAKSGEVWYVMAHGAAFAGDTTTNRKSAFYGRNGEITSCDDSIPHYHFAAKEIKKITGDVVVARPAVLYILDVPVMWFPFIFQDAREGRRSGVLTPRFGITELVRNSPTYRRTVENLGYYFALSDYFDASMWFDWRSSAMATDQDPGWTHLNGQLQYRWLDRFLSGSIAVSRQATSSGNTNTAVSWSHQQDFSIRSHLTANLNYVTSTTVQRQMVLNPLAAMATIASVLGYHRDMGNVSMGLGGRRTQYLGRPQVDQELPTLSLTSKPLDVARWLVWTPTFNLSSSQSLHMDSQGDFANRYVTRSDGTLDSVKVDKSTRTTEIRFDTPFKVFDFQITSAVRLRDRENDYPERRVIVDPVDTSKRSTRVYQRTYLSTVDFDLNMNLPTLPLSWFNLDKWHIVPSVSISNVDPGPYFVRSERTGTRWVSQSKRLSYGLSASPTFFGLTGWGVGPIARFRHSITPTFSYSYSPAASVSTEYLQALGNSSVGYLGSLAQNRVTLTITQNIEAKLRQRGDSAAANPDAGEKIKVLSLTFTPLTWDFERAHKTGKSGFTTDNFGYTLRSDLLPGFDFGSDYSLFQGSVLSDTAVFSPYLTSIRASFSLDARSPITRFFARLLGAAPPPLPARDTAAVRPAADQPVSRLAGFNSVAGQAIRGAAFDIPTGRGFDASITFTKNQQRPPVGGNVIEYDPTLQCLPLKALNPIQYELCVRSAIAAPPQDLSNTQTTAGGSFTRIPPQTNIQGRTSFNLTPKWSASWSTNYDVERSEFGSHTVSLQRDLHDWRAVFGFTQAPNGSFAFTFFISLKAQQDIKFNYDRSSYRQPSSSVP